MMSAAVSQCLESLQPEISQELGAISTLARSAVPAKLLELCTGYIDSALVCQDWVAPESGMTDQERACIEFTEQFVTSVSNVTENQINRLLEYACADEVYAFVHALYVIDMTRRLDMVGREVLL
ncbi:MAG: hypothetical protein ABJL54_02440 [Halioglobus sp.]